MEFEGKLIKRNGSRGIIEIDGVNWFDVNKKASGKIIVEIEEKDDISNQQRRLLYALWRDYEIYTGTPLDAAEAWFKYQYMLERNLDTFPSLSRGAMTKDMATDFITYTLEYYLNNGIPFAQQDWYKGADLNRVCYAMLMNRVCFVCGKEHSDIHHLDGSTVGMGNKREEVNHIGRMVVCLCRNHHQKMHMSEEKFMADHHFVPIKVTPKVAWELNMMTKKQIEKYIT